MCKPLSRLFIRDKALYLPYVGNVRVSARTQSSFTLGGLFGKYVTLPAVLHFYLTCSCQLKALLRAAVCFDLRHLNFLLKFVQRFLRNAFKVRL